MFYLLFVSIYNFKKYQNTKKGLIYLSLFYWLKQIYSILVIIKDCSITG